MFYNNPVPATVAIVVGPRGILLCRRAAEPYAGYWDLAGGFLEADETPERGLRRELREELGARVQRARFRGFVPDRYGRGGFPVLGIVYEVRVAGRITPGERRDRGALGEARRDPVAAARLRLDPPGAPRLLAGRRPEEHVAVSRLVR